MTIERGLNQQKITRQERRHRFGGIDGRRLVKGGVCVTPFALLFTQVGTRISLRKMFIRLFRISMKVSPIRIHVNLLVDRRILMTS